MKFKKEDLIALSWDDKHEGFEVVSSEIVDTSRWSIHHEMIFKHQDKFYRTHYSVGATEQQDESPYEYEDDEIECVEVKPVEKTVIVYEKV